MNRPSTRLTIAALAAATGLAVPFAVSAALRDEPAPPPPVADPFPLWRSAQAATEPSRVLSFRAFGAVAPLPTMGRAERTAASSQTRGATVRVDDVDSSRESAGATNTAQRATTRSPAAPTPVRTPVPVAPATPAPAPSAGPPATSEPRRAAPRPPSGPRFDSGDSFDSTG